MIYHFFEENDVNSFMIIVGSNLSANNFYKNEGATIIEKIVTHSGAKSNVYLQELN